MELRDRVAIISEDNFRRLSHLYGKLNMEDLQRIVNKHVAVAIEEIEEDITKEVADMNQIYSRVDIEKRIGEMLHDEKIVVGGHKEKYKRKYHLMYSQKIIRTVIGKFLEAILDILAEGDTICFKGYFTIEPQHRDERKCILHGEKEYTVPEKYVPSIKPGKKLKDACEKIEI